jgi:hypothetical protein
VAPRRRVPTRAAAKTDRAMRGVTPALSACRRPLHRRLVESGKPTASPRRLPETQFHPRRIVSVAWAIYDHSNRSAFPRPVVGSIAARSAAGVTLDATDVRRGFGRLLCVLALFIVPFCRFTSACPAKYQHLMPSFL